MKNNRYKLLTIIVFLANSMLMAQDVHFTQFENVPLMLNPALTGAYEGKLRIGGVYRNQWSNVVKGGYSTPSIYADFPVWKGKNGDKLAFGLSLMSDRTGSAQLTTNNVYGSLAYHKALGGNGKHVLSIGFQGGYVQKSVDRSKINLGSEWNSNGDFIDNGTDAYILDTKFNNLDMNAGLLWNSTFSNRFGFYIGGAYDHLMPQKENFITNANKNELKPRYKGYGGLLIGLTNKLRLNPQVLYETQQKASELVANLVFGYDVVTAGKKSATFMFGGGYRNSDAGAVMAGVDLDKRLKMMVSYDITTSDLGAYNNRNGAIEFTLSWILRDTESPEVRPVLFCPRF